MPGCRCLRTMHMHPPQLLPAVCGIPQTVRCRSIAAVLQPEVQPHSAAHCALCAYAGDPQRAHRDPGGGQPGGRPLRPLQAATLQRGPAARHPVTVRAPTPCDLKRNTALKSTAYLRAMTRLNAASPLAPRMPHQPGQRRHQPALFQEPRAPSAWAGCGFTPPAESCGRRGERRAPARRFDLLHIMIDEPHDALDYQIASHIVGVHMRRDAAFAVPYDMRQVQRYLKYARAFRPEMTPEVRACGGRAGMPGSGLDSSSPEARQPESTFASRDLHAGSVERVWRKGCLACAFSAAGVWRCKPHAQSPTSRPAPCCCRSS